MKKGILKVALYYLIGMALVALSYFTVSHTYMHGPALYHLVFILTFIGGFLWLIAATVKYFTGHPTDSLKGVIVSNLIICLSFLGFVVFISREDKDIDELKSNEDQITMDSSGDTTTMYHNGNLVYIQVKDSIILNLIDSTRFNTLNFNK